MTPCPPDLPVLPGQFAETRVASEVWSEPGEGTPVDLGLVAGMGVWVTDVFDGGDVDWYRIQFQLTESFAYEWVFGWLPATANGTSTLMGHESSSTPDHMNAPCPDELADGWLVAGADPPRRLACSQDAQVTITGYLGRQPPEAPMFSGTPDWLANEPTLVLWSVIGPAATGFQLPLHVDPESAVTVGPELLSEREALTGQRVHVTGHFGDIASEFCRRSARQPGFPPMSETEQQLWCYQQFVVDQILAGDWIEPDLQDMDTCHNAAAGYRISFPDAWYTNTAYGGDMAACQFFNPGPFVVAAGRPARGVAVSLTHVPEGSGIGRFSAPLSIDDVTVAGRPAVVSEWAGTGEGGASAPWVRRYEYVVELDGDSEPGPYLWASTTHGHAGDYETNKEVLDAMMRTLELTEP